MHALILIDTIQDYYKVLFSDIGRSRDERDDGLPCIFLSSLGRKKTDALGGMETGEKNER